MRIKYRTTIHDVAEHANVSIKTVSRVLNNESKVRLDTRNRVLDAVKKLKYKPNISARSLAGERSYLIGMLYDNPSISYISNIQMGALSKCRQQGYHLIIEQIDAENNKIESEIRELADQSGLDGIILTQPLCDHPKILKALKENKIPFVRIAPDNNSDGFMSVQMDEHKAAYEMTSYLISLGHESIAFIKGDPRNAVSTLRYQGYTAAMSDGKLKIRKELIRQGDFSYRSGLDCAETLLKIAERPTAIFASNDDMAAAVVSVAHKLNILVPDEISVAGFDDTPVSVVIWPKLTTIHQPITEMAAAAVELLIKKLLNPMDNEAANKKILDFKLLIRESTAPLSLT